MGTADRATHALGSHQRDEKRFRRFEKSVHVLDVGFFGKIVAKETHATLVRRCYHRVSGELGA